MLPCPPIGHDPEAHHTASDGASNGAESAPPNTVLMLFSFCTGLVDSLTYSASAVWCAFVTGTTVQLGMSLPSLIISSLALSSPRPSWAHFAASPSSRRITALAGFVLSASAASHALCRLSPARSTALQAGLLALAAVLVLLGLRASDGAGEALPCAHLALALVSASMAAQAVLVQHFATPYATSVAWTSIWLGLVAPGPLSGRVTKACGLAALMSGAALGTCIITVRRDGGESGQEGVAARVGWGLLVSAGVKLIISIMFWRRAQKLGAIHL